MNPIYSWKKAVIGGHTLPIRYCWGCLRGIFEYCVTEPTLHSASFATPRNICYFQRPYQRPNTPRNHSSGTRCYCYQTSFRGCCITFLWTKHNRGLSVITAALERSGTPGFWEIQQHKLQLRISHLYRLTIRKKIFKRTVLQNRTSRYLQYFHNCYNYWNIPII